VWPVAVVVVDEDAKHALEVLSVEDEEPVEAFRACGADEAIAFAFGARTVKGANIGVAARGGSGWEDRLHGLLLPLPRRSGSAGRACS